MAFDHGPHLRANDASRLRREHRAWRTTPIRGMSIRPGFIKASLVFFASTAALVVGAIVVAVVFFVPRTPNLPAFARPTGAHQLANYLVSCENTSDFFGASYRQLAFESDRSWPEIREEITRVYAERGWTHRNWNDEAFWEYAPTGNRRIFYSTGRTARVDLIRFHGTPSMPTVIAVSVSECPGP